jgi:Flp pilus assembly protein TadB
MERVFIIIACVLVFVAALFLWRWNLDGAFVAGALGIVAWFLSLRTRLRRANLAAEEASNLETDDFGDENED